MFADSKICFILTADTLGTKIEKNHLYNLSKNQHGQHEPIASKMQTSTEYNKHAFVCKAVFLSDKAEPMLLQLHQGSQGYTG